MYIRGFEIFIEIIGIEILTLKSHKVVLEKNITVLNLKLL